MLESKANQRQVGGEHYKVGGEEHWDRVARLGLDYFQACITKYVERCWKKNGLEDLKKAQHYLQKYIEINAHLEKTISTGSVGGPEPGPGYVEQDPEAHKGLVGFVKPGFPPPS